LGTPFLRHFKLVKYLFAVTVMAVQVNIEQAQATEPCPKGWWADVMLGSYHIHPYRHFDDFNPGVGTECSVTSQWALSFGYFRNSLDRPSFYGGAIFTPEFAHRGWFQLGAIGGIISGYNYGQIGLGRNNRTGPILAPTAIVRVGRFGANFILIPPIPQDNLPFTVGLQAKYRLH
jgi:hypothetical protein